MVKTDSGSTNIFNITDPHLYRCQLLHYHNRLSRLYLGVLKGQATIPIFYLLFTDVAYMNCPVNWQGADFTIAPDDDCIQLLLETGLIGQAILRFPSAYASITDYANLYTVQGKQDRNVQLIASSANMVHELPDDLA